VVYFKCKDIQWHSTIQANPAMKCKKGLIMIGPAAHEASFHTCRRPGGPFGRRAGLLSPKTTLSGYQRGSDKRGGSKEISDIKDVLALRYDVLMLC